MSRQPQLSAGRVECVGSAGGSGGSLPGRRSVRGTPPRQVRSLPPELVLYLFRST